MTQRVSLGQILADYDALFADVNLRTLVPFVKADQKQELIDWTDQTELKEQVSKLNFSSTRLSMKQWVNRYFFDAYPEEWTSYDRLFYERLFSFEKFLIILMVWESHNLKSMGPDYTDIPQALARFGYLLTRARKEWERIRSTYIKEHRKYCEESSFVL